MEKQGFFITFSGGEGCGKTTQLGLLSDRLEALGKPIIVTKEPGSPHCPVCVKIREILLDPSVGMENSTELFLYIADRAEHVPFVKQCLAKGIVVLSDRHDDETVAYQHFGRGLDLITIINLNLLATDGLEPDLTFLLDIDPEAGFARIERAHDRLEKAGLDFHKRVNAGFRQLARDFPERFVVINATLPIQEIQEQIFCVTMERLEKAGLWKGGGKE